MAITNGYITLANLKTYLKIDDSVDDTILEGIIESASRSIDRIANRRFYADAAATARTYRPIGNLRVQIDDVSSTTGLIVKTDPDGTGTYQTTFTLNTDYIVEPTNAIALGRPITTITIVGGFPTGAGTDIYSRMLAEPLGKALGVSVIIDNKSGAGGNVGSEFVARARPDGYTLYFGTAGTHAINVSLYGKLPFDVIRDFTHVSILGDVPNIMIVNPKVMPNVNSCADMMKLAREKPATAHRRISRGRPSPRCRASTSSTSRIAARRRR